MIFDIYSILSVIEFMKVKLIMRLNFQILSQEKSFKYTLTRIGATTLSIKTLSITTLKGAIKNTTPWQCAENIYVKLYYQ